MEKGKMLVILGCVLVLISGLLALYNIYLNERAAIESKKILEKIQSKDIEVVEDEFAEEEFVAVFEEMKIVNINGNDYIGTIKIPTLNLELPVMSDWDYNKMKIAPCKYYGNVLTNNLVICAHGYNNLFGRIKNLSTDDLLIFTDMNKKEYVYKVELIEILASTDVKEMIESEFDLTLYTCTMDGLNRVTVRLNRV